jgi:hypothetical protein
MMVIIMMKKKNKSMLKNITRKISSIIFLMLLMNIPLSSAAPVNILLNPGFESGTTQPLNWSLVTVSGNIPIWDTISHSGARSIKISNPGITNSLSGYPQSDLITAIPLQNHTFSAWGKTQGAGGTNAPAVRVVELDANKNWVRQTNLIFGIGTNNWTQKQITFQTSSSTAYLYIYANIWKGYGTFWVDDMVLSPTTTSIPTPTPTPTSNGIVINPDKTLSINGVKTFPQLFYTLCYYQATGTTCSDNLQKNSIYDADIITYATETVPQHDQAGMKFITTVGGGTGYINDNYFFGYMQPDEPISTGQNILALQQAYTNIKAADPNHVVIADDWQQLNALSDTADIIMSDLYAYKTWIFNAAGRQNAIYYHEYDTKVAANTLAGVNNFDDIKKPVYQTISAIGTTNPDDAGLYELTPTELRAWVYLSITMNMKGLAYWSYSWTPNNQGLDNNLSLAQAYINQAAEIKSLNDILVLPTKDYRWQYRQGTQVAFSKTLSGWNGFSNFNYMLKQNGNTYYLIVLNKDSRAVTTDITVQGLTGSMTATTLGNANAGSVPGKILSVNNGKFTDSFNGYAVHIYQMS